MKRFYCLRGFSLSLFAALFFFLTLMFIPTTTASIFVEDPGAVNNNPLISKDAVILTLRLQEGVWLDTALALEIDNVLEAARSEYDTLAAIHAFPDYIPNELLLTSNASWAHSWREGELMTGNKLIDSLTVVYHMTEVEFSTPDSTSFKLIFAQPLKITLLTQFYKDVPGVEYAKPNYVSGYGNDIDAFKKYDLWHLVFSINLDIENCIDWCVVRYYWYVNVDEELNVELVDERSGRSILPCIYLWNIPAHYAATVFSSVDELFAAAQFAPEWWVRRHAVEVIGRLFINNFPWVEEDFLQFNAFFALRDGVRSRRREVFSLLRNGLDDPDPDVKVSAQVALNRLLGFPEESLAFYFPLHVSNSWTFNTFTETIVDTQRIDDHVYFKFDRFRHFLNVLLRMSDDDKLIIRWEGEEQVWLDFSADVGETWTVSGPGVASQWLVHLESKTDTVIVPAGTFTNCYRFWFDFGCCDNDWVEWYAPGIGPVKRTLFGFPVIEYPLKRAVIDGIVIPGLKGDVDGSGELDVSDVMLVVNIILGLFDPTPNQFWAADFNGDEIINVLDVVALIQTILN